MNTPYRGSGVALRTYPDGRRERIPWASVSFETRSHCYHARRYRNGDTAFAVNCQTVGVLPNTPGTRKLLADFDSAEFAAYAAERS